MKQRGWLVQYGVTMALALGLGFLLSQVPLFHETMLGSAKLRASEGVQFLGFGGALIVLWQFGQRLVVELPTLWPKMTFLRPMVMPVCGQVLGAFLGKTGKGMYDWLFVIGIVSAAIWLILSWFLKAAPMLQSWEESSEPTLKVDADSRESHYVSPAGEEPA